MALLAIIDDDPDIIEAITTIMTSKGYETVSAKNVKVGEKLILENNPDLVILDVMMEEPDDGFFLAQKLRKNSFSNPIILLSSISKTIGFDFGNSSVTPVDVFLEKPISPQKLLETIENLLEKGGKHDSH